MEQKKRPAPRSAWKPGQSGNPAGRPRSGSALSEALRELPVAEIVERVRKALKSDDDTKAMAAASFVANHGYTKPESKHELTLNRGEESEYDLAHLSLEERVTYLALHRRTRGADIEDES